MAGDPRLATDRFVRLVVRIDPGPILGRGFATGARLGIEVVRLAAAFIDKILGESEIATFLGDTVEFDQCQLDFLVAAVAPFLAGSKHRCDIIHIPAQRGEQFGLAGRLKMRDGRLNQMAGTVQFVIITQVGPTFAGRHDGEIRVEIAVGLLGANDQIHHRI